MNTSQNIALRSAQFIRAAVQDIRDDADPSSVVDNALATLEEVAAQLEQHAVGYWLSDDAQDAARWRFVAPLLTHLMRARDGKMEIAFRVESEWQDAVVLKTGMVGGLTNALIERAVDNARGFVPPLRCMHTEERDGRVWQCDSYAGHAGDHSPNIDLTHLSGMQPGGVSR